MKTLQGTELDEPRFRVDQPVRLVKGDSYRYTVAKRRCLVGTWEYLIKTHYGWPCGWQRDDELEAVPS